MIAPWALLALGLLGGAALVRAAYRLGRRRRPCALPPPLVRELAAHKLCCLGETPERVVLELELLFGEQVPLGDLGYETSADTGHAQTSERSGIAVSSSPGSLD